jgi:hypothetical protein
MLVMTAHQYVVEAESYDEARAKIVDLFEEGVWLTTRSMLIVIQKTYARRTNNGIHMADLTHA